MTEIGTRVTAAGACLLVLALVVGAQEESTPLETRLDGRLEEGLRGKLGLADPRADDWTGETLNLEVGRRLNELGHWIVDPAHTPEGLEAFLAPGFAFRSFLPRDPAAPVAGGAPFEVRRPSPEPGEHAGAEGLAAELARLAAPLAGLEGARSEFHVFRIEPGEGTVRARATLHVGGRSSDGAYEANAVLDGLWALPTRDEAALRLLELALEDLEQVALPGRGPLFSDRTEELFGDLPAFRDELAPGISHWRARLDTALGLPILGAPAGIAVGDVNGDGLEDLFLCQPGGLADRLFLHRPDGTLDDASAAAGLNVLDFSRSALLVDYDGDGDRDLSLVLGDELVFFANDGQARFEPAARIELTNATSQAAADYDGDGDLDLYVCCYSTPYDSDAFPVPYHDAENGQANRLLCNTGDWRFEDATRESGIEANNRRFSFAASWEDYDDDGDPDLYVANDFGRNNLYRNDGGHFVDVAAQAGVEDVSAGMGVSWGDANGDGRMDLYVSNMESNAGQRVTYARRFRPGSDEETLTDYRRHSAGNTLFLNAGDGTFRDATVEAGVGRGRWAWGGLFIELNNDGREDLVVPNGFLTASGGDDL